MAKKASLLRLPRRTRFPAELLVIVPSGICTAVVIPTTTLLYTLPGTSYSPLSGPEEVASALDAANGLMATKNFVYELARFDPVAATIIPGADQLFFDNAGTLWMLSTAKATLSAQIIRR